MGEAEAASQTVRALVGQYERRLKCRHTDYDVPLRVTRNDGVRGSVEGRAAALNADATPWFVAPRPYSLKPYRLNPVPHRQITAKAERSSYNLAVIASRQEAKRRRRRKLLGRLSAGLRTAQV